MRLEGKGAVVTGGGRGIGAEVARELAARGARVVVSARSVDQLEAVAAELGDGVSAVACDVADPAAIEALREEATARLGAVDVLVNNAGIASSAPVKRQSLEEWNRLIAVNATGTFLCTQAFLPAMVERGWGRVINVASVAGKMGGAYIGAYSASKHAVVGFTRSLAQEVATTGVTANAICPGYVDTEMTDYSVARIVEKTGAGEDDARRRLEAVSPQQRLIEPEEVAFLVAMLCDERARGINGQALVIDGGMVQS